MKRKDDTKKINIYQTLEMDVPVPRAYIADFNGRVLRRPFLLTHLAKGKAELEI